MRILFCNYEYPPLGGGGGVVMAALARALARRHEVTVLTSRALDLPASSNDAGVQVLRVPVFFRRELAVANFPSMLAYLPTGLVRGLGLKQSGRFDVINTHFVVPTGPLGHALAAYYDVPNVLSVHGGDLYDPSKPSSPHRHAWLRTPIRWLLAGANRVIGQSRDTVRHVADFYGLERDIDLIPLGIERPPSVAASRAELGLPEDAFVLITIGRLVARKNTVQLVQALRACKVPNAHLVVVGDGPDAPAIRAAAAEAGLGDRVHLLGMASDAQKFAALSVADVFASTSQHEGFGLVFLEAMAFGLPVVCYDHGGQTDFLTTGETGAVIHLGDVDAFVHALDELGGNPTLCADIGRRNRERVESFFIDRCAERYEEVFGEAMELHRKLPVVAASARATRR